ncbi:Hypothetical predicted protein [Octopus vulgaris]|uniref:Uncharacterized protein n=1 Tax=Octopus vulgaris TaxID=6645 RepID=A0AA36AEU5_OCTVU|nr:Hypothetical predicted protein [Octopus vulgaris]
MLQKRGSKQNRKPDSAKSPARFTIALSNIRGLHFNLTRLFSVSQYGFRDGRSTADCLTVIAKRYIMASMYLVEIEDVCRVRNSSLSSFKRETYVLKRKSIRHVLESLMLRKRKYGKAATKDDNIHEDVFLPIGGGVGFIGSTCGFSS